ncbi:DUF1275 domain-containing protein [Cellulosimicrobium cellulans]|uniref:YoaK family protein n=1 Tax=Cellulosimicrobium cellulans TaxID=1710 RepID=UPI0019643AE9|nr:YoaK family protein [Cellulosimicrobium cellulans]MBN0038889.1 DUF1275 domain-containing protein [Cellulosimicrobium cellulans]
MSTRAPAGAQAVQEDRTTGFPLMELPFVGFLLAIMAGAMNAWTLANASTFSTVQSGNVVSLGYWLVQGNWDKLWFPALSVLAFGLGSALCGILMTSFLRSGRTFTVAVLVAQMLLLVLFGVLALTLVGEGSGNEAALDLTADHSLTAHWIAIGISFVAGAQGNAFHKNHGMLYGNIAVTSVVQMAFNFLMQSAFTKQGPNGETNIKWAGIFFLTILGFSGGAAIGFWADQALVNGASIFIPPIIALGLVLVAAGRKLENVDPTPGGTFV